MMDKALGTSNQLCRGLLCATMLIEAAGCTRRPVATGDDGFVVECVDLVKCNEQAAEVCPDGYETVAIAGREYGRVGKDHGAIKQMQVECVQGATAEAGSASGPPPTGAAGFLFDSTLESVSETCRGAGHAYTDRGAIRCSGLPTDLGLDAYATFESCGDKVCLIRLGVRPGKADDVTWLRRLSDLRLKLTQKYGSPKADDDAMRASCLYPEKCTQLSTLHASYLWTWESGEAIELRVRADLPRGPLIEIEYISATKGKQNRAGGL